MRDIFDFPTFSASSSARFLKNIGLLEYRSPPIFRTERKTVQCKPEALILHSCCPALTVSPSSTNRSVITPLIFDGTGIEVCKNSEKEIHNGMKYNIKIEIFLLIIPTRLFLMDVQQT